MASVKNRLAQSVKELDQSSVVKGRVEVNGAGVGGLIVRVFHVDDNRGSPSARARRALGSTLTTEDPEPTKRGYFEVRWPDALLQRADGSRPNLLVSVLAPEASSSNGTANHPIFETEVRERAAPEEWFRIDIEPADFKKHRVPLPPLLGGSINDPEAAGAAAEIARERQLKLSEQITKVRKKAVIEARRFELEADGDLRDRVAQHVTGVSPNMPQWKRYVAPGEDAQKITREHHKDAISNVINKEAQQGAKTYLVLSAEELAELGDPPDPAKVEQRLRQRNSTPSLLRSDPAAVACLRRRAENPFDPTSTTALPTTPTPTPTPIANVDAKVSELVQGISFPNDPNGGDGGRPDQNAVGTNVGNLKLSKGPADIPAFYNFHTLEFGFDHIWEDARADGALECAKAMYRAISDAGGDPKLALTTSGNPMRDLARELAVVRQAQERFAAPGVSPGLSARTLSAMYSRPNGLPNGLNAETDVGLNPDTTTSQAFPLPPIDWATAPLYESYPFTLFADKSVNFGLLVEYTLRCDPGPYQVGRIVSTQTLTPKETISVTMRRVVKTSFNRKQIQSNQQMRKDEAKETFRDEAEVIARAQAKTNYALSSQGGYDLGPFGSGGFTTNFGKDKESGSQETKRAFLEAVKDASQQITNESKWELETGETIETENTEKHEISNPNDSRVLTYIYYELQQRRLCSTKLKSVIPVILVGQHVPRPNEINDDWIRSHDWVIKRFLPDDSFRPALDYLANRERGDQIVLEELKKHMESLRQNVSDLKQQVLTARSETLGRYAAIDQLAREKADLENREDFFLRFYQNYREEVQEHPESKDALKILDEAAQEGYQRAVREEGDLRARLEREITALQVATDAYTKAYSDYTNQRTQIDRLIQYLKSDILRYMHGIWSYEHPDQLMFRHFNIMAPRLESAQRAYMLEELNDWPIGVVPQPGKKCYQVTFTVEIDPDLDPADKNATLAELADLRHPLPEKLANYIIFPLKKSNALTDFMMTPYLDAEFGLRDPDGLGNWTLQEFSDYIQCLRESLGERFAEVEADLRRQYQELLADPSRDGEEIVIPTNCLYAQMLVDPGNALEEFKEHHRKLDVEKVRAEVVSSQLDNLRRAKMVLDNRLDDPNIESVKNVYYRGELPPHDGDE